MKKSNSPTSNRASHDDASLTAPERLNLVLHFIYFLFYFLGTKTVWLFCAAGHALAAFFRGPFLRFLSRVGNGIKNFFLRVGKAVLNELLLAPRTVIRAVRNARSHTREAFERSRKDGVTCLFASVLYVLVQFGKALLLLVNYIAPAAAVLVLVLVAQYYAGINYALSLHYDGVNIGCVEDLSVYDEAQAMLAERLASINLTKDDVSVGSASYSVVFVPNSRLKSASDLCDQMIKASISDLSVAYGVYVDGAYYGAVSEEDGPLLETYLQDRLDAAVAALDSNPISEEPSDGEEDEEDGLENAVTSDNWTARFVKNVEVTKGYYPTEGLVALQPLVDKFDSIVDGEQTYIVQAGDSAWQIAAQLDDVTLDDLYAMNPWMEEGTCYPGDEIIVASAVPFLEIQLMAQVTYTEEIPQEIEEVTSSNYSVGYAKVTDEGTPGEKQVVANVVYQNGVEIDREVVSETTLVEPVNGTKVVGTKASSGGSSSAYYTTGSSTPTSGSGSLKWPVNGGYISCGYGGYAGHYGMDIAAPCGTAIYAADGGLVEVSTRNDSIGYGNYIIINHGNGVKTLYAHCSARYVAAGSYVKKGDVIAAVGATGWATGYHCHFEVRINGRQVNPAYYVTK